MCSIPNQYSTAEKYMNTSPKHLVLSVSLLVNWEVSCFKQSGAFCKTNNLSSNILNQIVPKNWILPYWNTFWAWAKWFSPAYLTAHSVARQMPVWCCRPPMFKSSLVMYSCKKQWAWEVYLTYKQGTSKHTDNRSMKVNGTGQNRQ